MHAYLCKTLCLEKSLSLGKNHVVVVVFFPLRPYVKATERKKNYCLSLIHLFNTKTLSLKFTL